MKDLDTRKAERKQRAEENAAEYEGRGYNADAANPADGKGGGEMPGGGAGGSESSEGAQGSGAAGWGKPGAGSGSGVTGAAGTDKPADKPAAAKGGGTASKSADPTA